MDYVEHTHPVLFHRLRTRIASLDEAMLFRCILLSLGIDDPLFVPVGDKRCCPEARCDVAAIVDDLDDCPWSDIW